MRVFCNICLGNPVFFSELKEIDEITLKGPDTYIKKVQKDTEYQVDNTRSIKFILQS